VLDDTSLGGALHKKESILKHTIHTISNPTETDAAVEGQLLSDYLDGDLKGNTRLVNLIPLAHTQRESPSKISWLDQQQATNLAATGMPTALADGDGNKTKFNYSNASITTEIRNLAEAQSGASAALEDSHESAQGNAEPSPLASEGGPSPFADV